MSSAASTHSVDFGGQSAWSAVDPPVGTESVVPNIPGHGGRYKAGQTLPAGRQAADLGRGDRDRRHRKMEDPPPRPELSGAVPAASVRSIDDQSLDESAGSRRRASSGPARPGRRRRGRTPGSGPSWSRQVSISSSESMPSTKTGRQGRRAPPQPAQGVDRVADLARIQLQRARPPGPRRPSDGQPQHRLAVPRGGQPGPLLCGGIAVGSSSTRSSPSMRRAASRHRQVAQVHRIEGPAQHADHGPPVCGPILVIVVLGARRSSSSSIEPPHVTDQLARGPRRSPTRSIGRTVPARSAQRCGRSTGSWSWTRRPWSAPASAAWRPVPRRSRASSRCSASMPSTGSRAGSVGSTRWSSRRQRSTWRRKRWPSPAPSWAPSIRPGMSATTKER